MLKLLDACLIQQAAGSNRALPGATPDLTVTAGETFSPLAQPALSAGQGPTPISVSIHYGVIIGPLALSARALSCAGAPSNDGGAHFLLRWFLRQFSYWLSRTLSWAGTGREAIALGVKESCQLCGNCLIGGVEVSGRERLHSFA
jgi:hypothetical protein